MGMLLSWLERVAVNPRLSCVRVTPSPPVLTIRTLIFKIEYRRLQQIIEYKKD